jgi:putative endonuclease
VTAPKSKRAVAGRNAESAAVDYLRSAGFEILDTNLRVGALELDVVARRGDLVAVIEVRTRGRGSYVGPLASVDARKKGRLLRAAARLWRERLSRDESIRRFRIDVVAVTFDGERTVVEHIEAAIVATE